MQRLHGGNLGIQKALASSPRVQAVVTAAVPLQAGIPVGGRGMLYYNASAGPLPRNAAPQLRLGVNRWETQRTLDMHRAAGINLPGSDWWCIELEFDQVGALQALTM